MTTVARCASVLALLLLGACAPGSSGDDTGRPWVGTSTTEGDTTTVVTRSGSVWGGTATLVEELSIGVDRGEGPYMFGDVSGLWATDERIYVVDPQVPVVRAYGRDGRHLMDLGGVGEGPGEYQLPNSVVVLPDGSVVVREGRPGQRTLVYSPEGAPLEAWYGDPGLGSGDPPVLTYDGAVYSQTSASAGGGVVQDPAFGRRIRRGDPERAMGELGPEGIDGEVLTFPEIQNTAPRVAVSDRMELVVPLTGRVVTAMLPSRAMVAGLSSDYRLVVERPDGSRMIVEKVSEPIPVSREERFWEAARITGVGRRWNPSFEWDGAEIPDEHPVFADLVGDRDRRIWVLRPTAVERVTDCTENPLEEAVSSVVPCFRTRYGADVFDEETGRFLGTVALPEGVTLYPVFIDGDTFLTAVEDQAGTVRVKLYRLVLPGEDGQ